jgi:microcin C transport system permease protein
MKIRIFKNPVAKKRFLRFKSMKRAYFSFWVIFVLYGLSLFSEVVCNNVPLYVKYNGQSYFPVVTYYSESEFTGSGRQTRPDYRRLSQSETFADNSENYMIFPLIPFSPLESINPNAIFVPDEVELKLTQVPQIGTVDIQKDFTIARSVALESFLNVSENNLREENLAKYFMLPDTLKQSVAVRFANQATGFAEFTIQNYAGEKMLASLATFRPRKTPPGKIRVTLKEMVGNRVPTESIIFNRSVEPVLNGISIWHQVAKEEARMLLNLVQTRFDQPVDDYRLVIDQRQYTASFIKEAVRFPYPPGKDHPMGIDGAGRDVLARIIYGFRISLTFGLMLVGCSMVIGVMVGSIQGYYAGKLDITAQRMIEIWSALPFLYVMILMGSIYGRSFALLLICYGLFNWVGISYYIRAEFLSLRKRPFVEAAKCMGVSPIKIIYKHILPNALVPVITFFPFFLVGAIGALAALDYLGFGLPPPTPSWGELLFQAQQYRWAWWLILYPSLALFSVMLLGVFVGEGIRKAYDPKQYSRFQ